jgi:hypothetical protein
MKTIIAALALVLLAAGPTFAQAIIQVPQPGHYARYADAASTNQFTSREGLVDHAP